MSIARTFPALGKAALALLLLSPGRSTLAFPLALGLLARHPLGLLLQATLLLRLLRGDELDVLQ